MLTLRAVHPADLDSLAQLWFDGWHEAHAAHVPAELTAKRTIESFRTRLGATGDRLRVAGAIGAPLGFCAIQKNELYQLFIGTGARGTGLAAQLLADGEARLAAKGVTRAFLLCVPENLRAFHFYQRQGWENCGLSREAVETLEGPFAVDVLRFEKTLRAPEAD